MFILSLLVEEVLTEDNTLNLKQAKQKAHNSFGVMGFHPIAEALGKGLSLKYKQIYWKYVRQLITSPKWILVFMLVFFFGYQLTQVADKHNWNQSLGMLIAPAFCMVLSTILELFGMKIFRKIKNIKPRVIYTDTHRLPSFDFIVLIFFLNAEKINHLTLFSILFGLYYAYTLLRTAAHIKSTSAIVEDIESTLNMQNSG